ncbi:hypothetical protein [Pantoea eucrina]|uniref:hypothetical protein n=1 Tax=Pantoea eucrina TaxID=472693 RepID=UPI00080F572B|nr:hypothetical protein [Pantoea eucrina]
MKTSEMQGETLNYAVGLALGENVQISTGNPDAPYKSVKTFFTRGNWDRAYRFNPTENAKLFSRLRIPAGEHSNLPDACRAFVKEKLGDEVQIPKSLAGGK